MLKKMFGPKLSPGEGDPVEPEELRNKLLELFPSQGDINKHLNVEHLEGNPLSFKAIWEIYTKAQDEYISYHITNMIITVDIQPEKNAVHLSHKEDRKLIGVRKLNEKLKEGVPLYSDYNHYRLMRVGNLQSLTEHEKAYTEFIEGKSLLQIAPKQLRYLAYRFEEKATYKKRIYEELVGCATGLGWNVVT